MLFAVFSQVAEGVHRYKQVSAGSVQSARVY